MGFGFLFETGKTKKGHKEHTSMKPHILNQSNERKAIANKQFGDSLLKSQEVS